MSFATSPPYTFSFKYNRDGTLESVTSPNYTSQWEYENGRAKKIVMNTGGQMETITFEYPSEKLIRWTSSIQFNGVTRQYYLYHTGDKVDSLKVIDPENLPQQEYAEYDSEVIYSTNNNVTGILSESECCVYSFKDIEYDNGLNPVTLLRQSTGVFTGRDLFGYVFFGFYPQALSVNNPTKYTMDYTVHSETGTSSGSRYFSFEYTYSQAGSYPLEVSEFVDGNLSGNPYHFVYENCP